MERASFSLPFRVPSFHFKRKSTPSNDDNCPVCHSSHLRRTHALRHRVASLASLRFLSNAPVPSKWKDENRPPNHWKCNDCGWIGVKGNSNSPATTSPPPVNPAVPWQRYDASPRSTPSPQLFPAPTSSSPTLSTPSLPSPSSISNGNPRRSHRASRPVSSRSAWSKFAGSFSQNGAMSPAATEGGGGGGGGVVCPGARPEPITEMNPLYQAAEKWHRPPSFIFRGISENGATGAGGADSRPTMPAEGGGGWMPRWLHTN